MKFALLLLLLIGCAAPVEEMPTNAGILDAGQEQQCDPYNDAGDYTTRVCCMVALAYEADGGEGICTDAGYSVTGAGVNLHIACQYCLGAMNAN